MQMNFPQISTTKKRCLKARRFMTKTSLFGVFILLLAANLLLGPAALATMVVKPATKPVSAVNQTA